MKNYIFIIFILFLGFSFYSCEEEFAPSDVKAKQEYVVEGHLEASRLGIPTFVILSKSTSYFSTLDSALVENLYIDDADVFVFDGQNNVELSYVCAKDLSFPLLLKLYGVLGNKIFNSKFCAYLDLDNKLNIAEEREYKLHIEHEGNIIESTTTIPKNVMLDSLYFKEPPGDPIDSAAMMWVRFSDPKDESDFYRYFVIENFKKVYSYNSLFDDMIVDGKTIDLPFRKPVDPRSSDFNRDIGFTYLRGDTLQFKLCALDKAHYGFWESFQFSNNQGPFTSYIRAKNNIEGGIGIWGGYACKVVDVIVPMK